MPMEFIFIACTHYFVCGTSLNAACGEGGYGVLNRTDVIAYGGDRLHSVSEYKEAATSRSNESVFRDGLSFFDDFDRVVLPTKSEANRLILELIEQGYEKWPDGRNIRNVIFYKNQS